MADVRALRDDANAALAAGKFKRALVAYMELERLEPRDAQWPKRTAETLRRLGKDRDAIEAYARSVDRYAQSGFLVQAIAVCKIILSIDPQHGETLRKLAEINEQVGAAQTRAAHLADNNPTLHADERVNALRQRSPTGLQAPARGTGEADALRTGLPALPRTVTPVKPVVARTATPRTAIPRTITPTGAGSGAVGGRRTKSSTTNPPLTISRTKSRPINLPPNAPLDALQLSAEIPLELDEPSQPGIHVLQLDDEVELIHDDELVLDDDTAQEDEGLELADPDRADDDLLELADGPRPSVPHIMVEVDSGEDDPIEPEVAESTELELAELEDIPLPEPRAMALAAQRALAATPLFAGLSSAALEALVEELHLVSLDVGEVLFREGDPGDALYVIAEGEVSVQAEGPPRVEMARLGPGTFLGEVALMTDQPRSATVVAATPAELLRIDRGTLARVLAGHGDVLKAVLRFVRDRLIDRWMRTSPLFRPFSDDERAALAAKFRFLEIDPNTRVLGVGQRPDGLYIVLAGKFVVARDGKPVAQLGPGDLIGETALLSGGAFKSDVIAHHRSLALCLPATDFREMIMTHPHVLEYVGEQAEHSRRLQIL